ncbi:ORF6N domain-containing protein [Lachnospiraceae bacterium XBB2008]|nr:ORF6N domain-containing protein [Lachnospiraceae bacterium XBB2008]
MAEANPKTEMVPVDLREMSLESLVYTIRGQQVMLDSDLATIYGYEVKRLNEQVKRNKERFPEDFMFRLTEDEIPISLRSQFATLNEDGNKRGAHRKYLPYAFTEQGVNMLATVLKGEIAVRQSIAIMRAFREMRHFIQQNLQFVTKDELKILRETMEESSHKISIRQDKTEIRQDETDAKSKQSMRVSRKSMIISYLILN